MAKPVIFSGIQPTGNLHIGNYLGAVKNWVTLQNSGKYDCYFSIVDLHSLTGSMDAATRRKQILGVAAELLAAGIDLDKSTLFVQSHVPEHTELGWVFNTITPVGELRRMTQFKSKSGRGEMEEYFDAEKNFFKNKGKDALQEFYYKMKEIENDLENRANAGLFTYPVLQAADILLYHGTRVPVGQDQVQHIELTRNIARWFNNRYGEYFPDAEPLLTEIPKVMSLLEPTKKMSKSLGADHVIEMGDSSEEITRKLKRAVTATEGGGEAPGVTNLLLLLKEFGDASAHKKFVAAEKGKSIRYGDLKQAVGDAIATHFENFREKKQKLLDNPKKIEKALAKGAKRAQGVAAKTMEEVRERIGIR